MLSRREFLATSAAAAGAMALPDILHAVERGKTVYGGWFNDPAQRLAVIKSDPRPYFSQHNGAVRGTGEGQIVLLHPYFEEVTNAPLEPYLQGIGDCVAQATALGVDILGSVQIKLLRKLERFVARTATEPIYAGSRVEIGGGITDFWGRDTDGSHVAWAVRWLQEYGVLLRQKYGEYDLTEYDPLRAREWGHRDVGCPDELEEIAKQHPVRTAKLIRTWDDFCDALANGYPVIIGSNVGFCTRCGRDKDGFMHENGKWLHAMLAIGFDDRVRRGGLLMNSWGKNWVSGPRRFNQPEGSFWAEAETIVKMLKQGDSYAISDLLGFRRRKLPYKLY